MTDICDHCGKPIKRAVRIEYLGFTLKYGPKCAAAVKRNIAAGIKPITYGRAMDDLDKQVKHANA